MDIEKVITGLELCTNISPDGCLMLCPYKDEGFCEQVLKQDALTLINTQHKLILELQNLISIGTKMLNGGEVNEID